MNSADTARVAGRLKLRFDALTERRVRHKIAQLAERATPKGIRLEAFLDGLRLSGRGLKRRMIDDPQLRNFGR